MITLTPHERAIADKINQLKNEAGSHSPSLFTITEKIKDLNVQIDACFLANSYATDLFAEYLKREVVDTGKLRDLLEFYPSQNRLIAEKLSNHLGVPTGKIFVGNGATEIIQAVLHRFSKKKIIINIPTFSSYYEFALPGTEIVYNKLSKTDFFKLDISKLIEKVKAEKPDTLVIINPNNPDGGYIPLADIHHLLENARDVQNVIVDESFIHFAFETSDFSMKSCVDFTKQFKNLMVIKSMSKDFGIAGIRVGYAVMDETKVDALLQNGFLWNVSGLAEYFLGLYVRSDFQQRYETIRVQSIKETQEFIGELKKINGLKVYPSMANFMLVELVDGSRAEDFVSKLLIKHGIYVRVGNDKIGLEGEFVRIAARKKHENQIITQAIRDTLR